MKRIILALLTIISLIPFFLSLVGSLAEPQVQSQLELSQTNLMLEAMAGAGDRISPEDWQPLLRQALAQEDPYRSAQSQYEQAQRQLSAYQEKLKTQLNSGAEVIDNQTLARVVDQNQRELNRLGLNLGLLQQQQGKTDEALKTWQALLTERTPAPTRTTAALLIDLHQGKTPTPEAEQLITEQLQGWFRWRALEQLYRQQAGLTDPAQPCQTAACQQLATAIGDRSGQALTKLLLLVVLPLVGCIVGGLLIIALLVQWVLARDNAILATHAGKGWDTPWDGETIWQVLVVGFLFPSQILLPLVVSILPVQMANLALLGKALYVLATYGAIAIWGLVVLFLSLKPFRPLPADWFTFRFRAQNLLWGIGGYLVALPLVVLISLINQQIWQGQGGSNPLLSLALDSQNWWVLGIFFFTAAILAPVFEEIIFRGFLLPSLTKFMPVSVAILLSSLLFAVAHLNLSEILPLLALGMVLGTTYSRSRDLGAPMLLHACWNSGTLLSLFVLGGGG